MYLTLVWDSEKVMGQPKGPKEFLKQRDNTVRQTDKNETSKSVE